VYERWM